MVVLSEADSNLLTSVLTTVRDVLAGKSLQQSAPDHETKRSIRQSQRRLTPSECDELVRQYKSGLSANQLAISWGMSRQAICVRLKTHGVTMRNQSPTPEQVAEMVRLYGTGLSLEAVSNLTGFVARSVLKYLREQGVQMRDSHGRPR